MSNVQCQILSEGSLVSKRVAMFFAFLCGSFAPFAVIFPTVRLNAKSAKFTQRGAKSITEQC